MWDWNPNRWLLRITPDFVIEQSKRPCWFHRVTARLLLGWRWTERHEWATAQANAKAQPSIDNVPEMERPVLKKTP